MKPQPRIKNQSNSRTDRNAQDGQKSVCGVTEKMYGMIQ